MNRAMSNRRSQDDSMMGEKSTRMQLTVCESEVRFSRPLFTGKERDTESGNDYFGARYYASSMGRWLSPDWSAKEEPVPYAKLDDPQSLNLYSYVGNNPLARADEDGHCPDDDPECMAAGDSLNGTPFHNLSFGSFVKGVISDLINMLPTGDCGGCSHGPTNPATTPEEAQGQQAGAIAIGLGGGALALPEAAPAEVDAALGTRATAIQGAQDSFGQTKSTVAAASVTDANGNTSVMVGSSRNALTPSQRAALAPGETAVTGKGHPEVTVINAAQKQGLKVNAVGASRPICDSCAQAIKNAGAKPVTPLKNPPQ